MAFFEVLPLSQNKLYLNNLLVNHDLYLKEEGKLWFGKGYNPPLELTDILYDDSAYVKFNNKIYVIGTRKTNSLYPYELEEGHTPVWEYDGTRWILRELCMRNYSHQHPEEIYPFSGGIAVVYNNKIHIFGSNDETGTTTNYASKKHVSWDPTTDIMDEEADLLTPMRYGGAVVLSNGIHRIGGNPTNLTATSDLIHEYFDGSSWHTVGNLPFAYDYHNQLVIAYDNKIYLFGGGRYDTFYDGYYHIYTISGGWEECHDLPWGDVGKGEIKTPFYYKNKLCVPVQYYPTSGNIELRFYTFDGTSWTLENFGYTEPLLLTVRGVNQRPEAVFEFGDKLLWFTNDYNNDYPKEYMLESYSTYTISKQQEV